MRIIAAYMLAVLGGNDSPDAAAINKILDSVGIKADAEQPDLLIKQLAGKDLDELIAAGEDFLLCSLLSPVGATHHLAQLRLSGVASGHSHT